MLVRTVRVRADDDTTRASPSQIIHEVLRNPEDRTHLTLVFGNQTPDDVLLRGELEGLAAAHPARFKLVLLVDKAPGAGWTGAVGYVTPELLRATMPPPGAESLVVVCGPPGLMKARGRRGRRRRFALPDRSLSLSSPARPVKGGQRRQGA